MFVLKYIEKGIGRAFYSFRGRDAKALSNSAPFAEVPDCIKVQSDDFQDGGALPVWSTGNGDGISPSLSWTLKGDVEIGSYVVVLQDLDPPTPSPVCHLCVYDIPSEITRVAKGEFNKTSENTQVPFKFAVGALGSSEYLPPRGILGHGPHRNLFQVLAVDSEATKILRDLAAPPKFETVEHLIKGHVLAKGSILGEHERF